MYNEIYNFFKVWSFGPFMCKLCKLSPTINMFSSIFFLTSIAIDRWLAVVHSNNLTSKKLRRKSSTYKICFGTWVMAIVLGIPFILWSKLVPHQVHDKWNRSIDIIDLPRQYNKTVAEDFYKAEVDVKLQCQFFVPLSEYKIIIGGTIELMKCCIGFFLPVIVISFCYIKVVITVRKKTMNTSVTGRTPVGKVTSLSTIIITAFIICWFPMQLLTFLSAIGGWFETGFDFNPTHYDYAYPYTLCLAWSNSVLNPLIYACSAPKIRKNMMNMFCCFQEQNFELPRPTVRNTVQLRRSPAVNFPLGKSLCSAV